MPIAINLEMNKMKFLILVLLFCQNAFGMNTHSTTLNPNAQNFPPTLEHAGGNPGGSGSLGPGGRLYPQGGQNLKLVPKSQPWYRSARQTGQKYEGRTYEEIQTEKVLGFILDSRIENVNVIRNRLEHSFPDTHAKQNAKDLGLSAVSEATQSYQNKQINDGDFYSLIATEFADIALGMDPLTGFGRGVYEFYTGENFVTGEALGKWERGLAFVAVVSAGSSSTITKTGSQLIKLGSRAAPHSVGVLKGAINAGTKIFQGIKEGAKSSRLRHTPGTASLNQIKHQSGPMLKGTEQNAGFIPSDVAQDLVGKTYKNFNQFRKDIWKAVAKSSYAREFSDSAQAMMRQGKAPIARLSQDKGSTFIIKGERVRLGRTRYEIHHLKPISKGGGVYDLENLIIATPKYHVDVFHRGF